MKTQIIAIGGGAMSKTTDTFPIEKYILDQTGKSDPKICFMATATGDADRDITRFYEVFGNFHCERTHLSLFSAPKDIESLLMKQNVIYVGGGNTRNLLALWREWSVDKILFNAWKNGIVLTGFSAGSICWFEEGLSDYIPSELNPIKALGFLQGSHCPHYDSESNRRTIYCDLISKGKLSDGIAAEDDVALHYINGKLTHVISANPYGMAYDVVKKESVANEIARKPDIYV